MSSSPDFRRLRSKAAFIDWVVQEASEISDALREAHVSGTARSVKSDLRLSASNLIRCADFVLEVSKAAEALPLKADTEALPSYVVLDISQLRSLEFLDDAQEIGSLSLWREGLILPFNLRRQAHGTFRLDIGELRSPDRQSIDIHSTRPSFGGVRYWLMCPSCESRNMKLYRLTTQPGFKCRTCHKADHDSGWRTARDRQVSTPVIQHQMRAS